MGPLLAFSVVAALLGGGAGAWAYYQNNYGPTSVAGGGGTSAPISTATLPTGLTPLGNTGLLTSVDNPYTGAASSNGQISFSSYTDPTTGATVVEQAAGGGEDEGPTALNPHAPAASTGLAGGINAAHAALGAAGKSPSASGMAALQSVEANASHLLGGLI